MERRMLLSGLSAATAGALAPISLAAAQADAPDERLTAAARDRWAARNVATHSVRVNGATLHVAQAGQGDLVVLLHGYPQSGEIWRLIGPELARTHEVLIPDLRGMGLSEVAADGYDLVNVAEDIHQLVAASGHRTASVVGHDWGGAVGAMYALRYRDEVTKLAFLESALSGGGFEDLWTFAKPNPALTFIPFLLMGGSDPAGDVTADLLRGREAVYLHHLWATFTGDKQAAPFESWQPYVAAFARPGIATSSASYYRAAYHSAEDVRRLIAHKLDIPVLAIAGEKGIGPANAGFARAFAADLQGDLVLAGAGHFVAEERPAEVTAALVRFLA